MKVHISFLGGFAIFSDDRMCDTAFGKKQVAVLKMLAIHQGKSIPSDRLIEDLSMDGVNPRNALKTMICRTRAKLNAVSGGLGDIIYSNNGKYCWRSIPGVTVDLLEVLEILDRLKQNPEPASAMQLVRRLIRLYQGELEGEYWLHMEYLKAVYHYIDLLRSEKAYDTILQVCRRVMAVDELDEHLWIRYLDALISLKKYDTALQEYRKLIRQIHDYYGSEESDELRNCYDRLTELIKHP